MKRGASSASAPASLLPLPLLAGGGWVGVKLLIFGQRATPPQPSPASRGGSTAAAQRVGRALAGAWLCFCYGLASAMALLLLWPCFCYGFAPALALLLIQLLQTVRAGRAPLYPGPLCGGEVRSKGPEGGIDMDVDSFSPAHGCAVEKPGRTSRTFWAGCPESAARGGLLFGLLFSWPSKRKVTRHPKEDETL